MSGSWHNAQMLMREALAILDRTNAPADVGAHLDLALARLTDAIEGSIQTDDAQQLNLRCQAGEAGH